MSLIKQYCNRPTIARKPILTELKNIALESDLVHEFISKNVPKDVVVSYIPSLEGIYPDISNEAWTEEEADGFVDKIIQLALKLFRGIINIAKSIWKRLYAIGARLYNWFMGIGKKSLSVKGQYNNAAFECNLIINTIKRYCSECINRGQVTDMELPTKVEVLMKAARLKQGPNDSSSPAVVLQWLASLKPSDIKGQLLKDLRYCIPEKHWLSFGYNTSVEIFTKEQTEQQKEINNFFLQHALFARDYLSSERLLQVVRESITGKSNIDIPYLCESIANKLIQPFVSSPRLRFNGNFTNEKYIQPDSKSVNDYIVSSNDKLMGFETAVTSILPAIEEANKNMMVRYQVIELERDQIIEYGNFVTNVLNVFETNRKHLWDNAKELRDSYILSEVQLTKLIEEVAPKMDPEGRKKIGELVVQLSGKLDKIISNTYNYWQTITTYQVKLLNSQLDALLQFEPVI